MTPPPPNLATGASIAAATEKKDEVGKEDVQKEVNPPTDASTANGRPNDTISNAARVPIDTPLVATASALKPTPVGTSAAQPSTSNSTSTNMTGDGGRKSNIQSGDSTIAPSPSSSSPSFSSPAAASSPAPTLRNKSARGSIAEKYLQAARQSSTVIKTPQQLTPNTSRKLSTTGTPLASSSSSGSSSSSSSKAASRAENTTTVGAGNDGGIDSSFSGGSVRGEGVVARLAAERERGNASSSSSSSIGDVSRNSKQ